MLCIRAYLTRHFGENLEEKTCLAVKRGLCSIPETGFDYVSDFGEVTLGKSRARKSCSLNP